jgi:hypothetical protein
MADVVHVVETAQHGVAERAGDKVRVVFDQGDVDVRPEAAQIFCTGRASGGSTRLNGDSVPAWPNSSRKRLRENLGVIAPP